MTFRTAGRSELPLIVSERFEALARMRHAWTTRIGGVSGGICASLNLAWRAGDPPENVVENRRRACAAAGADYDRLVALRQELKSRAVTVGESHAGGAARRPGAVRESGDAMVTDRPDLPLLTFSADCCLVLVADPRRRVIANVHASRPGTRGGIVGNALELMRLAHGCRPGDLVAAVGPSIGPCCYFLRPEVADDWRGFAPAHLSARDGRTYLDLKGAIHAQLMAAGVPREAVDVCDLCTVCRADWFYSFRRDGEHTGRFGALLWLTS